MAQGKFKQKVKLPKGVKERRSNNRKVLGPKKGARHIAPKKTRHVEAAQVAKNITKLINKRIEHDVTMHASSNEVTNFKLLASKEEASGSKKKE